MRDIDWEKKIGEAAVRLKNGFERDLLREAREIAKDPEVTEYLKNYDVPGWKKMERRKNYIAEEIWDVFENI